jgi:hypothetical protein
MNASIIELLTEKSMTAREIAKQLGKEKHVINQTLYKMNEVEKSDHRIPVWSLKVVEAPPAPPPTPVVEPPAPVVEAPAQAPRIATNDQHKYLVCLPTYGSPYIRYAGSITTRHLNETVQGLYEQFNTNGFKIHPMFRENPKWEIAHKLINIKSTKTFVNENGLNECVPNMGTILNFYMEGSCPHLCGDVALLVTKKALEKVCDPMTLQLRPEDDPELNDEEGDDDEEDDA